MTDDDRVQPDSVQEWRERLTAAGLMEPAWLALVEAAKADGSWTLLDAVEDLVVPDDLAAAPARRPRAGRRAVASSGWSSTTKGTRSRCAARCGGW